MSVQPRAIVLCDFDGTITKNDLTNVVWDHFLPYDWRARLLPDSERGLISATELMRRGYADVRQSKEEILGLLRAKIEFRPGFEELLAQCRRNDWFFAIVSNGLRFYIDAMLPAAVDIWAHEAVYHGQWHVDVPKSIHLEPNLDFKSQVVSWLKQKHPDATTIYIGDGRLDYEPAKLCERVFCVRGSALERHCREGGISVVIFDDFFGVIAALDETLSRGG